MSSAKNVNDESVSLLRGEDSERTVSNYSSTTLKPDSDNASKSSKHKVSDDADLERQGNPAEEESSGKVGDDDDRQRQYEGMPEMRKLMKYILPALGIGIFMSAADQTIIVSSYGEIGTELNALSNTSWIATAYFLTLSSFQPLYGKLSDIFSRKSCLLFAYAVFGLGSVLCGLSQNIGQLIAARAFSGIGGGGMTTVVSILISDIVPLRERGKWQGYLNIIYATGAGAGAPLGGLLVDRVGWRWVFAGQGPLCVFAIIAVALTVRMPKSETIDSGNEENRATPLQWKQKLRRIDFLGAFVLVAAIFALLLGFDHGSNVAWINRWTVLSLCLAIALFALFILVELRVAAEPFAPGHIIFEKSLFATYMCNFFSFGGWLAAIFYVPLYLQAVNGRSATEAGVLLIPGIIAGVTGSLLAGYYMQRTGKYRAITIYVYSTLTLGLALLLLCSGVLVSSVAGIVVATVICGFSNGIGVTTTLIALIANASRADQAVVTACSYLFRSLGSVFGVSLSATVVNSALRTYLESSLSSHHHNHNDHNNNTSSHHTNTSTPDAADIAAHVRNSLAYIRTLEPGVRAVVRDCYARATQAGFGLQVAVVAGAAVSAWYIREKRLGRVGD